MDTVIFHSFFRSCKWNWHLLANVIMKLEFYWLNWQFQGGTGNFKFEYVCWKLIFKKLANFKPKLANVSWQLSSLAWNCHFLGRNWQMEAQIDSSYAQYYWQQSYSRPFFKSLERNLHSIANSWLIWLWKWHFIDQIGKFKEKLAIFSTKVSLFFKKLANLKNWKFLIN